MLRTCVIGGARFIGSYVVVLLLSLGRNVTVVGKSPSPFRPVPDGVQYRNGHYGDGCFIRGILHEMDEVIALAHTTIPKTSFEDPVICVRPRNAYGPGQIPFTGQGLVATAAASILTGREILSYGAEKMIRDYIHVRDIASGIVAALELGRAGECYNIGSGIGRSTKEVIEMITSCGRNQGYQASIRELPERSVDVSANVLDSLKLMTETGWKPEIGFDKGISETWRWYSDNQNRILTNEYSSYCRDLPTC